MSWTFWWSGLLSGAASGLCVTSGAGRVWWPGCAFEEDPISGSEPLFRSVSGPSRSRSPASRPGWGLTSGSENSTFFFTCIVNNFVLEEEKFSFHICDSTLDLHYFTEDLSVYPHRRAERRDPGTLMTNHETGRRTNLLLTPHLGRLNQKGKTVTHTVSLCKSQGTLQKKNWQYTKFSQAFTKKLKNSWKIFYFRSNDNYYGEHFERTEHANRFYLFIFAIFLNFTKC